MKQKYNLALVPQIMAEQVIQFARSFSDLADRYILGKNSNPHVTLYQFEWEESDVDQLWSRVSQS